MLRSRPSRTTLRFADGDDVIFRGNFAFDAAVEIFVLEEDAGIVVADGGFDQAFGVVGRGRADDFEAGIVDEPHLGILRVERTAVNVSAAGPAQDERSGRAPEVVRFRDHVADLVEGAADEVHELEFGDGTHASERRPEGRAHNGGLGDGRVDHTLRAEAVDESVGDFERAAVDADVFAQAEDGCVAVHFFPDSLADGFEVGELGHGYLYGGKIRVIPSEDARSRSERAPQSRDLAFRTSRPPNLSNRDSFVRSTTISFRGASA